MRTFAVNFFQSLLCVLFFAGVALSASATPPAGYYEVWGDEFDGSSLDMTKWDYWLLGSRRDAVNVTNAASVTGGHLVITTYTSNSVNYTAMIANDATFRSRFGYWETSIEWGDTNGMWSAMWLQSPTMGTYLYDPFVSGSEIDVAEHRSTDGVSDGDIINVVQPNVHWNGYGSSEQSSGGNNYGSGLGSGFHTYGFLWTPSDYTIYIDGSNVRNWNYSQNSVPVSLSTEWFILSSEVDDTSTTWAGTIPSTGYGSLASSTTKLTVDYVRYYAPTDTIFWSGAISSDLTSSGNYISNMPPLSISDVTFSMLSGNSLTPSPGSNISLDGLIFLWMNNGVVFSGDNTITLGAGGIDMIAANHSVTINCPLAIGAAQTWNIGPNDPGDTLTVNGSISGSATLSKGSYGTVILAGTNSFTGTLGVGTGSTTADDGIVRLASSGAAANAAAISIPNNNSGSSILQLTGGIIVPPPINLNGRNTNVVSIESISGSNTLAGNLTINVGGANYWLQSDSGTLNFGGTISSVAGGTRTFTLQGNGNFYISGAMQNGSATTINLVKTNAGTLTIAGASTFSGATTNYLGSLFVNGTLGSSLTVAGGALGGTGVISGATTIQSGATLAPGNSGASGLSFGNSLILSSGCTNYFELNKSQLTYETVTVSGTVTLNGILSVTNLSGNLTAGDSFNLFEAGSYTGNFSTVTLPPLDYGLAWNTNGLTNGILSVVATVPPQFSTLTRQGDGSYFFSGTGPAFAGYQLDATTNLALPVWMLVTNIVADQNGLFQFYILPATNFSQLFWRLQLQ